MKPVIAALCILFAASAARAQAVVILKNNDYASCQYILDNFEQDGDLRSFMIDYTFGFLSGLNAQRMMAQQPVLDFAPIENPMLITWTTVVCKENPQQSVHQAMVKLYDTLLKQQQGG